MSIFVRLEDEETEVVAGVGDLRTYANRNSQDSQGYQQGQASGRFNLTKQQQNRIAALVEAAVFKQCGGDILNHRLEDWPSFVGPGVDESLKRHDVYGTFEVKKTNSRDGDIPVKTKDLDNAPVAFILGYVYVEEKPNGRIGFSQTVEITGWCKPEDYENGKRMSWSNEGLRYVPPRPIETLDIEETLRTGKVVER